MKMTVTIFNRKYSIEKILAFGLDHRLFCGICFSEEKILKIRLSEAAIAAIEKYKYRIGNIRLAYGRLSVNRKMFIKEITRRSVTLSEELLHSECREKEIKEMQARV